MSSCWPREDYMPNCTEFRPPRAKGNSLSKLPQNDLVPVGREKSARGRRFRRGLNAILILFLLSVPMDPMGKKAGKQKERQNASQQPAVIWRDPGDISTLNLMYGAGGSEHAPDPSGIYTFEREIMHGTSPKFDVKDGRGVKWRIKLGQEPQAETAATRLLWAAGYFVDEDYYLREIKVEGLPTLHRGQSFVSEGGIVHRVRLERKIKEIEKIGNWDWFKNPFVGSRELNGLRALMALLNNWDLKTINNA